MITLIGTRGCARLTWKLAEQRAAEKIRWLLQHGFSVEVVRHV